MPSSYITTAFVAAICVLVGLAINAANTHESVCTALFVKHRAGFTPFQDDARYGEFGSHFVCLYLYVGELASDLGTAGSKPVSVDSMLEIGEIAFASLARLCLSCGALAVLEGLFAIAGLLFSAMPSFSYRSLVLMSTAAFLVYRYAIRGIVQRLAPYYGHISVALQWITYLPVLCVRTSVWFLRRLCALHTSYVFRPDPVGVLIRRDGRYYFRYHKDAPAVHVEFQEALLSSTGQSSSRFTPVKKPKAGLECEQPNAKINVAIEVPNGLYAFAFVKKQPDGSVENQVICHATRRAGAGSHLIVNAHALLPLQKCLEDASGQLMVANLTPDALRWWPWEAVFGKNKSVADVMVISMGGRPFTCEDLCALKVHTFAQVSGKELKCPLTKVAVGGSVKLYWTDGKSVFVSVGALECDRRFTKAAGCTWHTISTHASVSGAMVLTIGGDAVGPHVGAIHVSGDDYGRNFCITPAGALFRLRQLGIIAKPDMSAIRKSFIATTESDTSSVSPGSATFDTVDGDEPDFEWTAEEVLTDTKATRRARIQDDALFENDPNSKRNAFGGGRAKNRDNAYYNAVLKASLTVFGQPASANYATSATENAIASFTGQFRSRPWADYASDSDDDIPADFMSTPQRGRYVPETGEPKPAAPKYQAPLVAPALLAQRKARHARFNMQASDVHSGSFLRRAANAYVSGGLGREEDDEEPHGWVPNDAPIFFGPEEEYYYNSDDDSLIEDDEDRYSNPPGGWPSQQPFGSPHAPRWADLQSEGEADFPTDPGSLSDPGSDYDVFTDDEHLPPGPNNNILDPLGYPIPFWFHEQHRVFSQRPALVADTRGRRVWLFSPSAPDNYPGYTLDYVQRNRVLVTAYRRLGFDVTAEGALDIAVRIRVPVDTARNQMLFDPMPPGGPYRRAGFAFEAQASSPQRVSFEDRPAPTRRIRQRQGTPALSVTHSLRPTRLEEIAERAPPVPTAEPRSAATVEAAIPTPEVDDSPPLLEDDDVPDVPECEEEDYDDGEARPEFQPSSSSSARVRVEPVPLPRAPTELSDLWTFYVKTQMVEDTKSYRAPGTNFSYGSNLTSFSSEALPQEFETGVQSVLFNGCNSLAALSDLRELCKKHGVSPGEMYHRSSHFLNLRSYQAEAHLRLNTDVELPAPSDGFKRVGSCKSSVFKKKTKAKDAAAPEGEQGYDIPQEVREELRKVFPKLEIDKWRFPPTGVDGLSALLKSIRVQCNKRPKALQPIKVTEASAAAIYASFADNEHDYSGPLLEQLYKVLECLDGTKSAGFARLAQPGTKCVWQATPAKTVHLAFLRLALWSAHGTPDVSNLTPEQTVYYGLRDPCLPYLKPEAHKPSKVAEGRFRVIWPLSVLDELLFAFLHKAQNKADIAAYQEERLPGPILPMVGVGHSDDSMQVLGRTLSRLHTTAGTSGKTCSSDATGWDFSVSRMLWVRDAMRRIDCYSRVHGDTAVDEAYCGLLLVAGILSSAHCFVVGSDVYAFDFFGLMPSAHPSTSDSNTCMRAEALFSVIERMLAVVGDDVVHDEELSQGAGGEVEQLRAIGTDSREIVPHEPWSYSFNSHYITYDRDKDSYSARFNNFEKLVVKLVLCHGIHPRDSVQWIAGKAAVSGGLDVLRNTPDCLEAYRVIIASLGYVDAVPMYVEDLSTLL